MSKPDGIPEDIWANAGHVWVGIWLGTGIGQTLIARAILAERERCAKIAEAETVTGTPSPDMTMEMIVTITAVVHETAKSIGASIRSSK